MGKFLNKKLQLWKLYNNIYWISFVYLGFFLNKNLGEQRENSPKSSNNLILIVHYKSPLLKVQIGMICSKKFFTLNYKFHV